MLWINTQLCNKSVSMYDPTLPRGQLFKDHTTLHTPKFKLLWDNNYLCECYFTTEFSESAYTVFVSGMMNFMSSDSILFLPNEAHILETLDTWITPEFWSSQGGYVSTGKANNIQNSATDQD